MADVIEYGSNPTTPRPASAVPTPPISAPPSQFHSPSLTRSPLLSTGDHIQPASANRTPRISTPRISTPRIRTPRFITPLGSPIRRALHLTRLDPQDAWLPITESRNGNAYYAAFHCLCSGIGVQALILPVAFTMLGWAWGIIFLTLTFIWQLYTLYLLVQLHESTEHGIRFSRYMQLANATFGEKLSKWLALFPIMYLSAGTCITLIIIGGSTSRLFFQTVCGATCSVKTLTTVEWYLVFTCAALVLSQLPNLNSIAGVSLIGAITAVGYCTLIWAVSVAEGRMPGVSYNPVRASSDVERLFDVLNALGIIAFAFRGHNLILEIQATMPSSEKHPSTVPMWKGVKVAYAVIAMCLFPLAIGGYWAYGQMIPNGGMLTALFAFHGRDTSRFILGLTSLFVIINALSSFQIYGMPMFDDLESLYTRRKKKPCPWWLRAIFRTIFGFLCFFVAVAIPFLGSVAGLIGGLALPVTLAYPCFMWLKMKKPKKYGPMWYLNWGLGIFGMALSVAQVAGGIYVVISTGTKLSFFKPR
ncbi:lysine histidine transporter-like 8 [Ricinus communis]|uniref:Amino acid transporter, putative n=1 Tax=Ricinus communis TaxID=3988 RepID=B9SQZ7_RICCO|nr:lysine histidine transporter-like 8 [Ricinus communis]EEF33958.1 amino acid transporter, putative [Ricinus communis]|eukprot:XP_002528416.1 lysine histidine transporter-like 8 [Ricinus communis]